MSINVNTGRQSRKTTHVPHQCAARTLFCLDVVLPTRSRLLERGFHMKVLRLIIIAAAISGLASCSSADSATPATTVAATTTTTTAPDCSPAALEATVGEKTYTLGCTSNWAALQPSSWECGEHCYGFIYKWDQAKWNLAMKCSLYSPLSAEGSCQGMTGQISDANYTDGVTEFPPTAVACELWKESFVDPESNTAC